MPSQQNSLRASARPGLFVLIAMSAMGPIALNIFIPSMPGLQKALQTDYATAQLTLTLYLVSLGFSQLLMGPLSDRFGRRPVLLCGLTLYVIASIYCSFAVSIDQLIIGRILQAAGGCAGVTLSRAIVRDIYPRDKAASLLGYVTMTMAIAPMLSPVIGGYLDQWAGWRAGFYLISLLGLLLFVFCLVKLPETNKQLSHSLGMTDLPRQYLNLLKNKAFLGYTLCMSLGSAMFFAFVGGAPFIVIEIMKLSPSDYGLYFILISTGYMFGNFLTGRYSTKLGMNRMIVIGNSAAVLGMAAMFATQFLEFSGPLALFAPMVLITLSNGLIIPNCLAGALSVQPGNVGAASGLAGFCQVSIGALSTLLVGVLHNGTIAPTVGVIIAAGFLSIIFFQLTRFK
ncbi:MAG: multidrug effflux MFS transporter [Sneathiella sp.]